MNAFGSKAVLLTRSVNAALLLAIFVAINLAVVRSIPLSFSLAGMLYAWLLELSAFALAYDMSQAILCLVLRESHLPSLPTLERQPAVALLCVTCDDVDLAILRRLGRQDYANLDIFILDDSRLPESRQAVDSLGLTVVRRRDGSGFKAGNLNNWVFAHGSRYDYFVVADADSVLPDDFVEQMVRVAEHPHNHQLAIIESTIYPWNESEPFAKLQATAGAWQRCRQLRLLNHLDATLSVGHNNIYRTAAMREIGGFAERYLAEDFATTIALLQQTSWKCKTVGIRSYERAPANLAEFARRQARWAYQTFQLHSLTTGSLSWEIKLSLLRALYHYSLPVALYVGMLWLIGVNASSWPSFMSSAVPLQRAGSLVGHPALGLWLSWLLLPALLRWVLLVREGVRARDFLRCTLFQAGLFFASAWPVIRRLAGFRQPRRRQFEVTGRSPAPRFLEVLTMCGPGIPLAWITLLSFVPVPYFLALNLAWLAPACLSPILVWKAGAAGKGA